MRYYFASLLVVAAFLLPWFAVGFPDATKAVISSAEKAGSELAAVILSHNPVTIDELKTEYATATNPGVPAPHKIRILVVPGHEPDFGGAEGYGLKERDLNLELAQDLIGFLRENNHYDVFTTRDAKGWTPEFSTYFKSEWTEIGEWVKAHVSEVKSLQRVGQYARVQPSVYHVEAPQNVALRLYGINKWVDENDIDIAIHIHFNDYPGHGRAEGKYTGFSIYVPQRQYYNSTTTRAIAETVYARLAHYNPVSNLPGEVDGIVEDQDLIAIGAFNSVDAASMLVEYGYLYEPRFHDPDVRHSTLREMAYETYLGIMDFFEARSVVAPSPVRDTLALPHEWKAVTADSPASDVFALQTALVLDGDFPPAGANPNECYRSGKFGPCTKAALEAFQRGHGITGEKGAVGEKTLQALNEAFIQ